MNSKTSIDDGAAGEIRTPEVRHHRISNPAQWPGYATAAVNSAKLVVVMNMTVDFWPVSFVIVGQNNPMILVESRSPKPATKTSNQGNKAT